MVGHPIDSVVVSSQLVQKGLFRDYMAERTTLVLASSSEIQAMVLPDTTTVVFDGRTYVYDAADTTSVHDPERCLVDATPGTARRYLLRQRVRLAANRTYYVRTDGNDNNTGLVNNAGGAFLTVQRAVDVTYTRLDLNGSNVDIQLGTGTFARAVIATPQVGRGTITIRGDNATPANVIMTGASFGEYAGVVDMQANAVITVIDLTLTTTGSGGSCLFAQSGGKIFFNNLRFGACINNHILANKQGYIEALGNYAIVGGATRHCFATEQGYVAIQGRTLTITGTPAFSIEFATADAAGANVLTSNTYSGSATGKRFSAIRNGFIYALGGLTELPGNSAGTVSSGGIHPALGDQEAFIVALSDNTSVITVGANKAKFRMPYAFTVTEVRGSLFTAQATGSIFTVDVNKNGTTIISTKITIDNTETTSTTAATPPVISVPTFANDDEVEFDVDQVGDGTARGLIVSLIGYRT